MATKIMCSSLELKLQVILKMYSPAHSASWDLQGIENIEIKNYVWAEFQEAVRALSIDYPSAVPWSPGSWTLFQGAKNIRICVCRFLAASGGI